MIQIIPCFVCYNLSSKVKLSQQMNWYFRACISNFGLYESEVKFFDNSI